MARAEPPDPGLPIKLEPCGNGEFVPPPVTPMVREVLRRANAAVERNAERLGMSRRQFLRTSMASATVLSVLGACSSESGQTGGEFVLDPTATTAPTASPTSTPAPAATATPAPEPTATMEPEAAEATVGPMQDELIFDVQAHLLDYDAAGGGQAPGFPQSRCGEADPRDCYDIEHFLEAYFVDSDTHMLMLSAIPFGGGALSPDVMLRTMEAAENLGCTDRVFMQGESFPTSVGLDGMTEVATNYPISAFKTYTHNGGPPWRLDDDTGNAYLDHVRELGIDKVAVHKGLSGNDIWSSPADVGPAAVNHPDVNLLIYHSGYETAFAEGPYDPANDVGVNRLITSVLDAGIGPGGNVFAELGSTWRSLMTRPDEAAHLLGKLLVHFGEDNVLWGTDSIWYGSPQDQIEAFRVFQISEEFQERFGYPALTQDIKRKILGYNAARIFGLDPVTAPCDVDRDELVQIRAERHTTFHTHPDVAMATYQREQAGAATTST